MPRFRWRGQRRRSRCSYANANSWEALIWVCGYLLWLFRWVALLNEIFESFELLFRQFPGERGKIFFRGHLFGQVRLQGLQACSLRGGLGLDWGGFAIEDLLAEIELVSIHFGGASDPGGRLGQASAVTAGRIRGG